MKFQAMGFCSAAPERQPKAGRGEVSGNEILFCRAGATTESRAAAKTRATSGRVPRQIYAPKHGRGEVSGNEILFCRAGATTESRVAVKFRAKRSYSAAPERQPKAGPR